MTRHRPPRERSGEPRQVRGPGLQLKANPGQSSDDRRVFLRAAQSSHLAKKPKKPTLPKMPWEDE